DPKSSPRDPDKRKPAPPEMHGRALFKLADSILDQPPEHNLFLSTDQARRLAARSPHVNRARIYRYLARCEDTSRPVVAAAYRLRAFRIKCRPAEEIAALEKQLDQLKFAEEKVCLQQWSSAGSVEGITNYLEERRERFMEVRLDPCEYV